MGNIPNSYTYTKKTFALVKSSFDFSIAIEARPDNSQNLAAPIALSIPAIARGSKSLQAAAEFGSKRRPQDSLQAPKPLPTHS